MIARVSAFFLLLMTMALSCAEDDGTDKLISGEKEPDTSNLDSNKPFIPDSTVQHCDSLFIATYHGTACCISGPMVAEPGDSLTYYYQMNHKDPQVAWKILEGDMSIIAGQDSTTVTVLFGPGFTKGLMIGVGNGLKYDSLRQNCTDRVIVTRD